MNKAAIYVRISQDSTGEGLGVERQREDGESLAAVRGLTVVTVLADNDISAAGGKTRPGFERLLVGLESGEFTTVIAWNLDRLTRNRRDTTRLIETAQNAKATIALCRGSDLDMATPAGRLVADLLASVARNEIEVKGDRQKRALRQHAESGKPWWSRRPFGYERDGAVVESEAALLRQAYADLLDGKPIKAICREWRDAGVLSPQNSKKDKNETKPIAPSGFRRMILHPRNIGMRTLDGEIVAKGTWKPIIDRETFDAVTTLLTNPARRNTPGREPRLLTNFASCARCGGDLVAYSSGASHPSKYRCRNRHNEIQAAWLDDYVIARTVFILGLPGAAATLTEHDAPNEVPTLRRERIELTQRRDEWLSSGMSPKDVKTAIRPIDKRIGEIDAALVDLQRNNVFAGLWDDETFNLDTPEVGVAAFLELPRHRQKELFAALFSKVAADGKRRAVEFEPTALCARLLSEGEAEALARVEALSAIAQRVTDEKINR